LGRLDKVSRRAVPLRAMVNGARADAADGLSLRQPLPSFQTNRAAVTQHSQSISPEEVQTTSSRPD
jgi:hypothetical protein